MHERLVADDEEALPEGTVAVELVGDDCRLFAVCERYL
jgi:hypothetical protein